METKGLLKRSVVLIFGLFIMALGIAISVKANLGTSPISSVPFVYSLIAPISMGSLTIILHVVFILMQVLILRKDFNPIQLLQLPIALLFGFFTDATLWLISADVAITQYPLQWAFCLLSIVIIAFGVMLEVKARVIYLAGEGLSLALSKASKFEFGKVKVCLDSSLVIIAIISSFAFLHTLRGIREGTVASALLVGTFVRVFSKKFKFVDAFLTSPDSKTKRPPRISDDQPRIIITIGREYGSGGHQIGQSIAQKMGISFYDSKLIDLSAEESGFSPDYIKENEQKMANRLLFDLYEQNYEYINEEKTPLDTLFTVQSKIIREITQRESCVIVGRCAEFIVKENPALFSVFITAAKNYRIHRIIEEYRIAPEAAEKEMEKIDRMRSVYYQHYTHTRWGAPENYHLIVDSAVFGVEKTADLIVYAANASIASRGR